MARASEMPCHVPRQQPSQRCCCLVIGMHNSGTSLLGNLLHAAGVPMGERLLLRETIPAERRPRYDYFEDEDVVTLQEQTLLGLQRHWSSYRAAFELPAAASPGRTAFRHRLRALVDRRLQRQRLWAVKDPRSGVLLEDWFAVLTALEVEIRLLVVNRDPASNIRSFSSKGQVPALWAEALWQRTYANALEAAAHLPAGQSALTSFDQLMAAPEEETRRLCTWLDWKPPADLARRVAQRLDPSLPTHADGDSGSPQLHPATQHLQQQLRGHQLPRGWAAPKPLLADSMANAVGSVEAGLQLNGLEPSGQSLLPKLHVTIVTAELQGWGPSGGIGSAFGELIHALAAAGHPVRVVLVSPAVTPEAAALPTGVSLDHVDSTGTTRLDLVRRVADAVAARHTEVVHVHDWLGLGSGLKCHLGAQGPRVIVGLHGPSAWTRSGNPWPRDARGGLTAAEQSLYDEGLVRALELDGLQQADHLIAPSQFMAEWVCEHLLPGTDPATVSIQRNCPLHQRIRLQGAARTPEGSEPGRCVFFGRLEERKGLVLFLEALARMAKPPAEVLFLGQDCQIAGHSLGSDLVRQRLASLGVTCRFETTLNRDQALSLLRQEKAVVVVPSLIENSPCVLEELLDSGLRVVATDVGGSRELLAKECVRWLSPAAPEALARHLQAALSSDDPEAYQLRARIPGWIITLSWQAFHERLPRRLPPGPAPTATLEPPRRRAAQLLLRVARALRRRLSRVPRRRLD